MPLSAAWKTLWLTDTAMCFGNMLRGRIAAEFDCGQSEMRCWACRYDVRELLG
jgi:hypothetical protein